MALSRRKYMEDGKRELRMKLNIIEEQEEQMHQYLRDVVRPATTGARKVLRETDKHRFHRNYKDASSAVSKCLDMLLWISAMFPSEDTDTEGNEASSHSTSSSETETSSGKCSTVTRDSKGQHSTTSKEKVTKEAKPLGDNLKKETAGENAAGKGKEGNQAMDEHGRRGDIGQRKCETEVAEKKPIENDGGKKTERNVTGTTESDVQKSKEPIQSEKGLDETPDIKKDENLEPKNSSSCSPEEKKVCQPYERREEGPKAVNYVRKTETGKDFKEDFRYYKGAKYASCYRSGNYLFPARDRNKPRLQPRSSTTPAVPLRKPAVQQQSPKHVAEVERITETQVCPSDPEVWSVEDSIFCDADTPEKMRPSPKPNRSRDQPHREKGPAQEGISREKAQEVFAWLEQSSKVAQECRQSDVPTASNKEPLREGQVVYRRDPKSSNGRKPKEEPERQQQKPELNKEPPKRESSLPDRKEAARDADTRRLDVSSAPAKDTKPEEMLAARDKVSSTETSGSLKHVKKTGKEGTGRNAGCSSAGGDRRAQDIDSVWSEVQLWDNDHLVQGRHGQTSSLGRQKQQGERISGNTEVEDGHANEKTRVDAHSKTDGKDVLQDDENAGTAKSEVSRCEKDFSPHPAAPSDKTEGLKAAGDGKSEPCAVMDREEQCKGGLSGVTMERATGVVAGESMTDGSGRGKRATGIESTACPKEELFPKNPDHVEESQEVSVKTVASANSLPRTATPPPGFLDRASAESTGGTMAAKGVLVSSDLRLEDPISSPRQQDSFSEDSRSSALTGPQVSALTFHDGCCVEVFVTDVISPTMFWIQPVQSSLESLVEEMCIYYYQLGESEQRLPGPPSVGMMLAACFTKDDTWYRGRVLAVHDINSTAISEIKSPTKSSMGCVSPSSCSTASSTDGLQGSIEVDVLYVDYGNRERLSLGRLRLLHEQFTKLPCQAVCCCLAQVRPLEAAKAWNHDEILYFANLVYGKTLQGVISTVPGSHLFSIDLSFTLFAAPQAGGGDGASASSEPVPVMKFNVAELMVQCGKAEKVAGVMDVDVMREAIPVEVAGRLHMATQSVGELPLAGYEKPVELPVSSGNTRQTLAVQVPHQESVLDSSFDFSSDSSSQDSELCEKIMESETESTDMIKPNTEDTANVNESPTALIEKDAPVSDKDATPESSQVVSLSQTKPATISEDSNLIESPPKTVEGDGGYESNTSMVDSAGTSSPHSIVLKPELSALKSDRPEKFESVCMISQLKRVQVTADSQGLLQVVMSHIVNPGEFYVHLATMEAKRFDYLLEELNATYAGLKNKDGRVPKVGELCCVHYTEDDKWYRAEVKGVTQPQTNEGDEGVMETKPNQGGTGSAKVDVFYVDFGNTQQVPVADVMPLDANFVEFPAQAVKCCLAEIEPLGEDAGWARSKGAGDVPQEDDNSKSSQGGAEISQNGRGAAPDEGSGQSVVGADQCKNVASDGPKASNDSPNRRPQEDSRLGDRQSELSSGWCKESFFALEGLAGYTSLLFADKWTEKDGVVSVMLTNPEDVLINQELVNLGLATSRTLKKEEPMTEEYFGDDDFDVSNGDFDMTDWDPMSSHYLSETNSYKVDMDDPGVATVGYKAKDSRICKFHSRGDTCYRGDSCPFEHSSPGESSIDKNETFSSNNYAPLPKEGSWVAMEVTAIHSPLHFWAQLPFGNKSLDQLKLEAEGSISDSGVLSEDEDDAAFLIDPLMENLNKFYAHSAYRDSDLLLPARGEMVVAQYSDDNRCYRAMIIDVQEQNGNVAVEVFYVDFGNSEWLPITSIHSIQEEFLRLPFQAIECFLSSVEPTLQEGQTWPEEALRLFEEETVNKRLIGHVRNRSGSILHIDLYCTENDREVEVSKLLIQHGYARERSRNVGRKQQHNAGIVQSVVGKEMYMKPG